jgi:hypothetical protein
MADEVSYLVPYPSTPRLYRSLSGYLQSIAHYSPPLASASLPTKAAAKAAAAKEAAKKKEEEKKEKTWIEIVLLDDLGQPVDGKKYVVELPDGSKKEGTLDKQGKAKVSDIDPGLCKISFPEIDWSAFRPAPAPRQRTPSEEEKAPVEPEKTWVEIVLVDDQGKPVPGAKYVLELPDGTEKKGTLGDDGKAKVDGVVPGTCKISFPDIEASAIEPAQSAH